MSENCWFCLTTLCEEDLVTTCKKCGVLNDREIYQPLTETEENMGVDYNDEKYQGKYVYMPKMGASAEFDIKEIKEVQSDNPKFNFSENVPVMQGGVQLIDDDGEPVFKKKDLGYHIEAELTNGKILSVTSFPAFLLVFKANNIQDGEKVKISHIAKGEYIVERVV